MARGYGIIEVPNSVWKVNRLLTDSPCNLCPRECGADRETRRGFCHCGRKIRVARAALHFWEEPCLSGSRGSGAVFFSGCTLGCCYCQNRKISAGGFGKDISAERLAEIFLALEKQGAHNLNLVTAAQFLPGVLRALELTRCERKIPVIYNCGGYEKAETVRALRESVDIFLPDLKYKSAELSARYSKAPDYFDAASKAVRAMVEQAGPPVFGADGLLKRGVVVRHLVLPGARKDSFEILRFLSESLPKGGFLLSLMSQYTPNGACPQWKELNRRITSFEYGSVVDEAVRLGLTRGYMQEKSSAKEEYTPPFDLEGV